MNKKIDFILCLTLGYLGIHKFYEKKISMSILYLFTGGLFFIGWIYDCIQLGIGIYTKKKILYAMCILKKHLIKIEKKNQ